MLNSHESGRQQISRKTSGKDMNNQFKKQLYLKYKYYITIY